MRSALLLSLIVLLAPGGAPAQTAAGTGTVKGVIRDVDGVGLPGADVVLTQKEKNIRRVTESNVDGIFDLLALEPGSGYKLEVTRKGHASWESKELQVPAGQPLVFEVTLEASKTDEAEATASARPGNDSARIGASVALSRETIEVLPLRGRQVAALALLVPTASYDPRLEQMTMRGQAPFGGTYLDGVATTGRDRSLAGVSQDATESIAVVNGVFPAELGNTTAGLLDLATRSGGNAYHGTVYEYFHDGSLTALQRYALGRNLSGNEHQFGVSVGGPIRGNKLFFFSNLEARNAHSQVLNRITSPLIADPSGTSVAASNCKATAAQCEAAIRFLQGQMNVLQQRFQGSVTGFARIDWRPSAFNSFRAEAGEDHSRLPEGSRTESVAANGGALGQVGLKSVTRFAKIGWTAVLGPNAVNEVSFGAFRDRIATTRAAETGLSTGVLSLTVAGVTAGAAERYKSSIHKWRRNAIGDQLSAVVGSHRIRAGATWSQSPNWISELYDGAGNYSYPTLTDFAVDLSGGGKNYTSFSQTLGTSGRMFRIKEFSTYAQDTWQPLRRLTVSGSLRWEKAFLPQPQTVDSGWWRTGTIPSPGMNFAPRVGAAYKLDDHTVARFGFGMFYAPFSTEFVDTLLEGHAKFQLSSLVNRTHAAAPVFPKVISTFNLVPAGTKIITYAFTKFWSPVSPQATAEIQRRLGGDFTLGVRYLTSPGRRLLSAKEMNILDSTTTKTYSITDSSGLATNSFDTLIWIAKASTNYSHVYEIRNGGASSYHSATAQLSKAMSHGIGLEASYTWSHGIANTNGPWAVPSVPLSTYSGDPSYDRGDANSDQRHRTVLMWNWQPHLSKSSGLFARYLVNGWQHSAIATLASGLPETALVQVAGQQFNGTTMLYPSSLNGIGGWARAPLYRVNSLRAGASRNVDVRLSRSLPFTERIRGLLAIEVFNVLNVQATTRVNNVAYTASAGVLKPVSGLGEGIAASSPRSAQVAIRVEF